jgi:aspartate aminotransferase
MIFNGLSEVGDDPILLVSKMYLADNNPNKVDLGVGVYKDAGGDTAILKSVKQAEQYLVTNQKTKTYLSPAGNVEYNSAIQDLIFGSTHPAVKEGRVTTIQAPGGTGGIRIGIDFLKVCNPNAKVWISDPTWPNHHAIVGSVGLRAESYRYYDIKKGQFLFNEMMQDLNRAEEGDTVIVHGCCHNASGADLSKDQWDELADFMIARKLVAFVDLTYAARMLSEKLPEVMIASSCSKNFAMYRDRAGSFSLVSAETDLAKINISHVLKIVRSIYSMPPDHGAAVVAHILTNAPLRKQWENEVNDMRNRVKEMRTLFVMQLKEKAPNTDFSYIAHQNGMFSYLSIPADKIQRLIKDYSIYMMANGRVNIAGFTKSNMDYVTSSIAEVLN